MFDRRFVCAVITVLLAACPDSGRAASPLTLRYRQPAESSAVGWERESLPVGNGFLGASLFGGVAHERIQITEGTLWNPLALGGLNNAAELSLRFTHGDEVTGYERSLSLDDAVASCRYEADGVTFTREAFASHPDRVLVVRLTASRPGALSFALCPEIPFVQPRDDKSGVGGKIGSVVAKDDTIRLSGRLLASNVRFEARIRVLVESGRLATVGDTIEVAAADAAVIIVSFATNYRLEPRVFLEPDPAKKLAAIDPGPSADERLAAAAAAGLQGIWNCHDKPPWGADYHFDVNMQLIYCPAFSTNLAESFQPLADYLAAIRPAGETLATSYIRQHNPAQANDRPGGCGWALAVRLNGWARAGVGDRAHRVLRTLLGSRTFPNLWGALRGPWDVQTFARSTPYLFQIDGNLGGTAGITEMLLQSHEDCVRILPALPAAWPTGHFRGLVARGNFVIDAAWTAGPLCRRVWQAVRPAARLAM